MTDIEATLAALDEALTNISQLVGKTVLIKVGGSTLGSQDTTLQDVVTLTRLGARVVIVHGGGATISQWLGRIGLQPRFVNGLRVTDAETMEVVAMVLAGKVNKELVAGIHSHGGRAIGLCGVDGALLRARQQDPALGLVGEVTAVDTAALQPLLAAGYIPVIAPIALGERGEILNLNADTAAAELAIALGCERLIFLTDVPGICDAVGNVLACLSCEETNQLMTNGVIAGGMVPKAKACLKAVEQVPSAHIIDGRVPRALIRQLLTSQTTGTTISRATIVAGPTASEREQTAGQSKQTTSEQ